MAQNVRAADSTPPELDGSGLRLGVVCGRFNDRITLRLLDGLRRGAAEAGVGEDHLVIEWVPGAFEIPYAAKLMCGSASIDAVVCLGAVIRGETSHYDFVAGECARGIQAVQLEVAKPVIFGVLTTEDLDQALSRSAGAGEHNVGEECALTAVEMCQLTRRWR